MLKSFFKKCMVGFIVCGALVLSISVLNAASNIDNEPNRVVLPIENSAITSCWTGFCGHKNDYYSYPGYTVSGGGTDYSFLQKYVDPGNSATITGSKSYSSTINLGLSFGNDACKGSLGISGSLSVTYTYSDTLNNSQSYRQYVHAGVMYQNRGNMITQRHRTYFPFYDFFGWNNYCAYTAWTGPSQAKVQICCGRTLLPYMRYDF